MRIVGLTFDDAPAFICPVCGKAYKSERGLQEHMKKEHPENEEPETKDPE